LGDKVEIGISIPTDREDVRAVTGRRNPSIRLRFQAAAELVRAGVPIRIHVAPLEPHSADFAARLADAANWAWIDWHQHAGAGFRPLYAAQGWAVSTPGMAESFADEVRRHAESHLVRVGQEHFADRWHRIQQETTHEAIRGGHSSWSR